MTTHTTRVPQVLLRKVGAKLFLIPFVIFAVSLSSCDKSSIVGLDVQPSNDLLHVKFQDTATLITKTVREDSLRTDESLIIDGTGLIGKYIDPVFGEATASMYTQMRLSTNISSGSFGTSPICDSVVLSLAYDANYYGKKDHKPQTVNVYEILEDIKIENSYYSSTALNKSTLDLTGGGYNFVPRPTDSVTVLGVKLKPQLRVPIDVNFGQLLLNSQTTGNLTSTSAFQAYMKGLYITTENTTGLSTNEGNILRFKMGDIQSKMTVYYHEGSNDSLKYEFPLGSVARFTHFTHNYSAADADIISQLSPTPPAQNNTTFIQSMSGLKTKIELPYLMDWLDSGAIAINKAELVIKVDISSTYQLDTFSAPSALLLFGINDDGTSYLLPDYEPQAGPSSAYYDGSYNSTSHEYHINIARYIQQLLNGSKKNNGMYLLASNGAVYGNRVVIGGGGQSSGYQMKLNITYTKLH